MGVGDGRDSALDGAGGQAGLPEALQAQEQHDQGDDAQESALEERPVLRVEGKVDIPVEPQGDGLELGGA